MIIRPVCIEFRLRDQDSFAIRYQPWEESCDLLFVPKGLKPQNASLHRQQKAKERVPHTPSWRSPPPPRWSKLPCPCQRLPITSRLPYAHTTTPSFTSLTNQPQLTTCMSITYPHSPLLCPIRIIMLTTLTKLSPSTVSPSATKMATRLLLNRTLRPALSLGLTTSLLAIHNQRPMRMDAIPSSNKSFSTTRPERKDRLDPEIIKQLSGGSLSGMILNPSSHIFIYNHPNTHPITGFAVGLLVSVFSKTLVLLAGIGMLTIQVSKGTNTYFIVISHHQEN